MKIDLSAFKSKRYCYYYPETGNIYKLTNQIDNDCQLHYIEINEEDAKPIISGEENIETYTVSYNLISESYELKKKGLEIESGLTVDDVIYEIKENQNADIRIEQDIQNNSWNFSVSDVFRQKIIQENISLNTNLVFSITKPNDPNILYKILNVKIDELIKKSYCTIPFSEKFEFNDSPISIYTNKRFNSYSFIKANNE